MITLRFFTPKLSFARFRFIDFKQPVKPKPDNSIKDRVTKVKERVESLQIPNEPVRLGAGELVANPKKFVESHLSHAQNESKSAIPYLERLEKFVGILEGR